MRGTKLTICFVGLTAFAQQPANTEQQLYNNLATINPNLGTGSDSGYLNRAAMAAAISSAISTIGATNLGLTGHGGVAGNLPVANLDSGTNASGATFWRGDGHWGSPPTSGGVAGTQYVNSTSTWAAAITACGTTTSCSIINPPGFAPADTMPGSTLDPNQPGVSTTSGNIAMTDLSLLDHEMATNFYGYCPSLQCAPHAWQFNWWATLPPNKIIIPLSMLQFFYAGGSNQPGNKVTLGSATFNPVIYTHGQAVNVGGTSERVGGLGDTLGIANYVHCHQPGFVAALDEGCEAMDTQVFQGNGNVAGVPAGTVSGSPGTGATAVSVNFTQLAGWQGRAETWAISARPTLHDQDSLCRLTYNANPAFYQMHGGKYREPFGLRVDGETYDFLLVPPSAHSTVDVGCDPTLTNGTQGSCAGGFSNVLANSLTNGTAYFGFDDGQHCWYSSVGLGRNCVIAGSVNATSVMGQSISATAASGQGYLSDGTHLNPYTPLSVSGGNGTAVRGSGAVSLDVVKLPRIVSGATDTIQASDCGKLVIYTSSSAVAVSLPQAGGSGGFLVGCPITLRTHSGADTVTPATSTIDGGASLTLSAVHACEVVSDGTNWQLGLGQCN